MYPPPTLYEAQLQEIADQLIGRNNQWFADRSITVLDKDKFWQLHPEQDGDYIKINNWNRLCVGLLVKKDGTIASAPLVRMPSFWEKGVFIDTKKCDLLPKINGHHLYTFFDGRNIEFHNIDGVSTHIGDMLSSYNCISQFRPLIKRLNIQRRLDISNVFAFVYHEEELYLVGGKNRTSLYEFSEDELDQIADRISAKRPTRYTPQSWLHIVELIKHDSAEKFVLRDNKTGQRALLHKSSLFTAEKKEPKIRPKLVEQCHFRRLLPFWKANLHKKIVNEFPQTRDKFLTIEYEFTKRKVFLIEALLNFSKSDLSKHDLVKLIKTGGYPLWSHRIILSLCKTSFNVWERAIEEKIKKMPTKRLMRVFRLKD